jgi:5-oxoprolinase (ATP-hydrolysing) subunit A
MAGPLRFDLNCDLGESFGRYELGEDSAMMALVSSANVACGFHAGDPDVMARTVALAKENGVALGAHPGFPDLQGFGRRLMLLTPKEIANAVCYQIGALDAFAHVAGMKLSHVKPHGALYNLAAQDAAVAEAIAQVVFAYDPALILIGLAGSELIRMGKEAGCPVANEGFPDRMYLPNGQLMPRNQPGAVITSSEKVADNALRLVEEGITINGEKIRMDTLCLHGDNPYAVENAWAVRHRLEAAGIEVGPLQH